MANLLTPLYELLNVSPTASSDAIRSQYKKLVLQYHPDKSGADTAEQFQKIKEAYGVLTDADKRSEYEAKQESAGVWDPEARWAAFMASEQGREMYGQAPKRTPRRQRRQSGVRDEFNMSFEDCHFERDGEWPFTGSKNSDPFDWSEGKGKKGKQGGRKGKKGKKA